VAASLPFTEKSLPQLVKESASFERRSRIFVVRLFFELQHLGSEEPERAVQVALEPADRHPWEVPWADVSMEGIGRSLLIGQAHRGPAGRAPFEAGRAPRFEREPIRSRGAHGWNGSAFGHERQLRDVFEQNRWLDDGIVFEREGRQPNREGG
jgi:hypothetical protein